VRYPLPVEGSVGNVEIFLCQDAGSVVDPSQRARLAVGEIDRTQRAINIVNIREHQTLGLG